MLERLKVADGFTFLSLVSGILAVLSAMNGQLGTTALLIICSAVFDKLDGYVARATGKANKFGMFLDSLIDLVSFGAVPVFISFVIVDLSVWLLVGSVVYIFAGAYRLARYQIEHDVQRKSFKGMPITMNAIIFPIILYGSVWYGTDYLLYVITVFFFVSGYLMVSNWRLPNW